MWIAFALALIAAALAAGGAAFALGVHRRGRPERERAAVRALCELRWSEFSRVVVASFVREGFTADTVARQPGDGGFDLSLRRGDERHLVQCKQGAFHVGAQAVRDLDTSMKFEDAAGAWLVTTGDFGDDARRYGEATGIQLIDGAALWERVREHVPPALVADVDAAAQRELQRKRIGAAAAGVLAGVVVFLLAPGDDGDDRRVATRGASPAERAPATARTPRPAADVPQPVRSSETDTLDPDDLARRRDEAVERIARSGAFQDVAWSSRTTLVLTLPHDGGDTDARVEQGHVAACDVLRDYDELIDARLQLQVAAPENPEAAGDARVRWRQCL